MILPSQLFVPATEEAGYFETDPAMFANWLAHGIGDEWRVREIAGDSVHQLAGMLSAGERPGRYLLTPAGDWTVFLTDGPWLIGQRFSELRPLKGHRAWS